LEHVLRLRLEAEDFEFWNRMKLLGPWLGELEGVLTAGDGMKPQLVTKYAILIILSLPL
jgi:hypothetical protein